MKKIMFYINEIYKGGAERIMASLAKQLSEEGYECILVTSIVRNNEFDYGKKVKRISLFAERIEGNFFSRNVLLIKSLRNLVRKERPDILISFLAEPNFRSIIACRGMNTKNIISVRNDPKKEYFNRVYRFLANFLFVFSDAIVFQTKDAQVCFRKKIQKLGTVIMNPLTVPADYIWDNKGETKKIITVGRLVPQKNQKLLIEAFAEVHNKFPEYSLEIYGEGECYEQLKEQINSLSLNNYVFLCGHINTIYEKLNEAAFFVLSSDYEGMSNAMLEALAVGLPVISTDHPIGGAKAVIEDGINGILVPVGNKDALVNAMVKIIENPSVAIAMGKQASLLREKLSIEKITKQWIELIEKI